MVSDPLHKANEDFRKGYYTRVISRLEPLALSYRDSYLFYYLLGTSCLVTGDIGGASTYLRRAEQLNFRHSPTLAALAAVHFRRGETDKAVQLYLDILGRDPVNKFARKALDFIKSNSDPERLPAIVESGGISALYPVPSRIRRLFARYLRPALFVVLAASVAGFLLSRAPGMIRDAAPSRTGLEGFRLTDEERKDPVVAAGSFEFVLTEREALASFEKAKRYFSSWDDEAALVEINRILLSNAAPSIKAKAESLKGFIREPDFTNVRQFFSYSEVARSPNLFEGVAVIWKGQASNVRTTDEGLQLDFLVGYHEKKTLEGVVAVSFSFPLRITPGSPLEILGRIRSSPEGFKMDGIAVHEMRGENP